MTSPASGSEAAYALPLDRPYMRTLGRTDDGVDLELAPDGALVYSMTPGLVSAVAADPGGFGPNYPVIEATSDPLAGQHVYYGHVAQALVRPGQHVAAGQPIAVVGHTGDAGALGHDHIEIGFSDVGGDPLDHHGAEAWTPSGAVMRSLLVTLWDPFHGHPARARAAKKSTRVQKPRVPVGTAPAVAPAFHRSRGRDPETLSRSDRMSIRP